MTLHAHGLLPVGKSASQGMRHFLMPVVAGLGSFPDGGEIRGLPIGRCSEALTMEVRGVVSSIANSLMCRSSGVVALLASFLFNF